MQSNQRPISQWHLTTISKQLESGQANKIDRVLLPPLYSIEIGTLRLIATVFFHSTIFLEKTTIAKLYHNILTIRQQNIKTKNRTLLTKSKISLIVFSNALKLFCFQNKPKWYSYVFYRLRSNLSKFNRRFDWNYFIYLFVMWFFKIKLGNIVVK